MTSQLQLLPDKAPEIQPSEIATLTDLLEGRDWLTAEQIATQLLNAGLIGTTNSLENLKRRIRAIANASEGRILSYPGSKGYKLTKQATLEEIATAKNKLMHQAGEMQARALQIDRVYHGKKL